MGEGEVSLKKRPRFARDGERAHGKERRKGKKAYDVTSFTAV